MKSTALKLETIARLFQFRNVVLFRHLAMRVTIVDHGASVADTTQRYGVVRECFTDGAWRLAPTRYAPDGAITRHESLAQARDAYAAYVCNQPFMIWDTICYRA